MAGKRYCYEYPRPMVTTDCVVFRAEARQLEVLLIKRRNTPHKGAWVLPGGFIKMKESLADAALRELAEETGVDEVANLVQLGTYGTPKRDPRGRVITVAFIATVAGSGPTPKAGDDAALAVWYALEKLPGKIGFDHPTLIGDALLALGSRGTQSGILFSFLPKRFSEAQLADLLFAVYGIKMSAAEFLKPLIEREKVKVFKSGKFRHVGWMQDARA